MSPSEHLNALPPGEFVEDVGFARGVGAWGKSSQALFRLRSKTRPYIPFGMRLFFSLLVRLVLADHACAEDWLGRFNVHARACLALSENKPKLDYWRAYSRLHDLISKVDLILYARSDFEGIEQIMRETPPGLLSPFYGRSARDVDQMGRDLNLIKVSSPSFQFTRLCEQVEVDLKRLKDELLKKNEAFLERIGKPSPR